MSKNDLIRLILALISILAVIFIVRDWYVLSSCGQSTVCIGNLSYYQHITKFAVTILAAFLTLLIGSNAISRQDRGLLQKAFAAAILADFSIKILHNWQMLPFKINYLLLGVCFFIIVQVLLIIRHSKRSATDKHFPKVLYVSALIFAINAILVFTKTISLDIGVIVSYAGVLIPSVFIAWKTPKNDFFPKKNAQMIRWGMIFFLLCDAHIALSYFSGTISFVAHNFVWVFYTPALVLLALSGFQRSKKQVYKKRLILKNGLKKAKKNLLPQ